MKSHIENEKQPIEDVARDLALLAKDLDHRHRQQRKIQFFLDIRGYFVANRVTGSYIEFGVYRGEMMYGAHHVLDGTGCFPLYAGVDTFAGEPAYSQDEQEENPYLKPGDFAADYETTQAFLASHIGEDRLRLVRGDFREPSVLEEAKAAAPFALAVIDCNISSSIRAAADWVLPHMQPGGLLFADDYFANIGDGDFVTGEILTAAAQQTNRKLIEYQTYPPCARAFVVM